VAAIHVTGVRGEPCGAVRWTAGLIPDDDLLRSKYVGVLLCIFMYFNMKSAF